MARPISGFRLLKLSAQGAASLASLAAACATHAQEQRLALSVAAPDGFSSIAEPRRIVADLYIAGRPEGEAEIIASPGAIRFVDPGAVLDVLPSLVNRQVVSAALSGTDLPTNAHLACSMSADRLSCGHLAPAVIGVIFDADRFRVDLFVNSKFLSTDAEIADRYIPEPDGGLSALNSFGLLISGDDRDVGYDLQENFIVAAGPARLRGGVNSSDDRPLQVDQMAIEVDRAQWRYSAGVIWSRGTDLLGSRKMLGVGIETQVETRIDRDTMAGTPIVVFLSTRTRVDVLRNGKVISSATYEPGNRQLDTSDFPEGTYDLVVRLDEVGGSQREERRLFTKSRRLPPAGGPSYFAVAGLILEDGARYAEHFEGEPYLEAGVAHRLRDDLAVEGIVEALGDTVNLQAALNLSAPVVQGRASMIGSSQGEYGAILQIGSPGGSRLNFTFDLRRIHVRSDNLRTARTFGRLNAGLTSPDAPFALGGSGDYSQASGSVSLGMANLRLIVTGSYRQVDGQSATYNLGPNVQWDVMRAGPFRLTAQGNFAITERGEAGFFGISISMLGSHAAVSSTVGSRRSSLAGDEPGDGTVASLAGSWSKPDFGGGDLAIGASYERDPQRTALSASAEYDHRLVTLAADLTRGTSPRRDFTQFGLGLQSTAALHAGAMGLFGKSAVESVGLVRVEGARPSDAFEVLVNERVAGLVRGEESLAVPLPAYRAYDFRIRQVSGDPLIYDGTIRRVGLYPGSVDLMKWHASLLKVFFGRLTTPDGVPLANAGLTAGGTWTSTDKDGFFRMETAQGADVEVRTSDGRSFRIALPQRGSDDRLVKLGVITCCDMKDGPLESLGGRVELSMAGSKP